MPPPGRSPRAAGAQQPEPAAEFTDFGCDCGPHRDVGQMRWVILDLGELPCLIDVSKIESGPLWRGRRRVRSTSRCRITLR